MQAQCNGVSCSRRLTKNVFEIAYHTYLKRAQMNLDKLQFPQITRRLHLAFAAGDFNRIQIM